MKSSNTFTAVYKAVQKVPQGKVTTYGEIAKYIGIRNSRIIGYALHANPDQNNTPCHRVVTKDGELAKGYAFGGAEIQKQILESEGIKFTTNSVDLNKYFYPLLSKSGKSN